MAKRYELNDQQCEMLPGKKSDPGRTAKDNRLFVLVRAHQQAATVKGGGKKGARTSLWGVPEAD